MCETLPKGYGRHRSERTILGCRSAFEVVAAEVVFRRGVSTLIGVGVQWIRFNATNDLKGSPRRRWGSFFDQHLHRTDRRDGQDRSKRHFCCLLIGFYATRGQHSIATPAQRIEATLGARDQIALCARRACRGCSVLSKTQTDQRATEVPVLIALPGGVCMCGPMGRRMFGSGRPLGGTRAGPLNNAD